MWELNVQTRKITPTDCNLGQLKRIVNCIEVSDDDQYMYCGTTSGDVIQVGYVMYIFIVLNNSIENAYQDIKSW